MASLQTIPFELPVLLPIFEKVGETSFHLHSFCEYTANITQLKRELDQTATTVICSLKQWIHNALNETVPLCIVVEKKHKATAMYHSGTKTFSNLRQCISKLRIKDQGARGCVVVVQGNTFFQCYALLLAYEYDEKTRLYSCDSILPIPTVMCFCVQQVPDMYSLLYQVAAMRKKQVDVAIKWFRLLAINQNKPHAVVKYGFHDKVKGMVVC